MPNYEVINTHIHSGLKLKPQGGYSFAAHQHIVSVVLHEFSKISLSYPIVFIQNEEKTSFQPMALMGLEPNKNLFVDQEGRWLAGAYVPAAFRRYPFALTDTGEGSFAICVDKSSQFLQQAEGEGEALFDGQGVMTPAMEKISQFLQELMTSEVLASTFCADLSDLGLLAPCEFKVQSPEGTKTYGGSFMVDEKKLATLNPDEFLVLRDKGYLGPIYAHLLSLMQVEKFAVLRSS
jgi:hypothetical protein